MQTSDNDSDNIPLSKISQMIGDESPFGKITNITNITASTAAIAEESTDDIRELAPNYYKLGNRLVSKSDFEYYVKNRYIDNIIDVKC